MAQKDVKLIVPIKAIRTAIDSLDMEEKEQIWERLDEEIKEDKGIKPVDIVNETMKELSTDEKIQIWEDLTEEVAPKDEEEISYETLIMEIGKQDMKRKQALFKFLDEQMAQEEEEVFGSDNEIKEEIQASRDAYRGGDYLTIEEYVDRWRGEL